MGRAPTQEAGPSLGEMSEELQGELAEIISNSKLSELYLSLARDLDVMEAKLPEEVRVRGPRLFRLCISPGRGSCDAAVLMRRTAQFAAARCCGCKELYIRQKFSPTRLGGTWLSVPSAYTDY